MIMLGGFDVLIGVIVSGELEDSVGDKTNPSVGGVGQLDPAHIGAIAVELGKDIRVVQLIDCCLITS